MKRRKPRSCRFGLGDREECGFVLCIYEPEARSRREQPARVGLVDVIGHEIGNKSVRSRDPLQQLHPCSDKRNGIIFRKSAELQGVVYIAQTFERAIVASI